MGILPYCHPKVFKYEVEKVLKELLDLGHIAQRQSPFASLIILLKKDGSILHVHRLLGIEQEYY